MIFEIISEIIQEGKAEVRRRRGEHERSGRLWREDGGTACNRRNNSTHKNVSQAFMKITYSERYIKIIVSTVFKMSHGKSLKTEKYILFESHETSFSILKLRNILSTHF